MDEDLKSLDDSLVNVLRAFEYYEQEIKRVTKKDISHMSIEELGEVVRLLRRCRTRA